MAGGGGAWKVAYADFVTAMMAFFLVMWITGQSPDTKQAISGYFRDPWGTSSDLPSPTSLLPSEMQGETQHIDLPKQQTTGNKAGASDTEGKNEDALARSKWAQPQKVHFIDEQDRSSPALVVRFDESSAELTDIAKEQLDRLMPALVGKLNKIEIRGHSTRRPLPAESPYPDLWALCFARCEKVMEYLEQHGIDAKRMRLSQSAAFEPLTSRVDANWQGENSRIEVFLLNELAKDVPGTQAGAPAKSTLSSATAGAGH